jgi:hypothetical protein
MIIVLRVLSQYWGHIGTALAVLLAMACLRGCGREAGLRRELDACLAKPPVVQTQTVTVKEKCSGSAVVKYREGSPCPDVSLAVDSANDVAVSQTQTAAASIVARDVDGLYLGPIYGSAGPLAGGIVQQGAWAVSGAGWVNAWQVGLAYRAVTW